MNGIVDISEYLRLFGVLTTITGGLLLRKMLQILFPPAKFVHQSRHQTGLVVKWGGKSGQQHH